MKVYIYCTKAKPYLRFGIYYTYNTNPTNDDLNGKIVASFELKRIELIENGRLNGSNWESLEEFDGGNQIAVKETGLYFWKVESYARQARLWQ